MYIPRSKNVPGDRRPSSQNLSFQNEIIAFLNEGISGKYGVRSAECGVWNTRSVEYEECRKRGVWNMRSVENAECGKRGV